MYIYGLDLSMSCTGVTVFTKQMEPVYVGSIETSDKDTHGKRLETIVDFFQEIKDKHPPEAVAIERGFSRFNTSTAVIYRVHGITNYFFRDVEQVYYPPKKVKEYIIKGDASKKLVRQIIELKYPDVEFKNEDESDSFAVGLTYGINKGLVKWDKKEILKLAKQV